MEAAPDRSLLLALIVAGSFFMENLDGTIIATALPPMARSFSVSAVDLSIGMTAYLLTLAVFIPISGWLADRAGARTVFGGAIAVFTAASVLCGFSQGLWSFTGARVLQGIGGAMMVPVGRMVVLRNTAKPDLMRAVALLTWPGLAAPILGPPVGGFITTYASWRWIFFLNLPLGLLGLALTARFVANQRGERRRPFDATGFVLGGVSLSALLYGCELMGRTEGTPWQEAALLIVSGLIGCLLAIRHARRHPHPLLDLSALRFPTFALVVQGGAAFRIAIGTVPFLLPLLFQLGFGLDPFHSGLLVLAVFAGNLGMKPLTTPVLKRWGFRTVLIGNGFISALLMLACAAFTPTTPWPIMAVVLFLGGLSRSMQFTATNTLAFVDVPQAQMSGASTLSSMAQQVLMGMGIAIGAVSLHGAMLLRGATQGAPTLADFRIAFVLIAAIAFVGVLDCLTLNPAAGSEVSGHHPGRATRPVPASRTE